jgi:hypothetical protein
MIQHLRSDQTNGPVFATSHEKGLPVRITNDASVVSIMV